VEASGLPASVGRTDADSREWRRAAGLLVLLLAFSAVRPAVLIGLPFILMVMALPVRRPVALLVAAGLALLALTGAERGGLWYAERGWAVIVGGWFAAATLRWPGSGFMARALGSVGGGAAVCAAFFAVRPGTWSVFDWTVSERLRSGIATALQAIAVLQGGDALAPSVVTTVYQAADTQVYLFPALLGLVSVAALGVAWWMYVRIGLGVHGALGPTRGFRFNDQLVWLFLGGLLLVVSAPGEAWTRTGSNAVVFMGGLYVLRGAAVVLFVNGGISVLGGILLAFGLLFLAPVILMGALFTGLGDTWLDLRAKVGSRTA
jgi:hypothetical protein